MVATVKSIKPINTVINQNLKLQGICIGFVKQFRHQLFVSCRETAKLNRTSRTEVSWGKKIKNKGVAIFGCLPLAPGFIAECTSRSPEKAHSDTQCM